jgi:predicted MFS family arabinose efflux permease
MPGVKEEPKPRPRLTWTQVLFGKGAEYASWNLVFFGSSAPNTFAAATYSDTKYLEFAEQFGMVGLSVLLLMGISAIVRGLSLTRATVDRSERADGAAITVMMVLTFVAMVHLPSLFLVGFGTSAFVAMAFVAGGHLRRQASMHRRPSSADTVTSGALAPDRQVTG